jgi:hypothetical protein
MATPRKFGRDAVDGYDDHILEPPVGGGADALRLNRGAGARLHERYAAPRAVVLNGPRRGTRGVIRSSRVRDCRRTAKMRRGGTVRRRACWETVSSSSPVDLQAIPVDLASLGRLGLSRILRLFHDCEGRRGGSSAFSQRPALHIGSRPLPLAALSLGEDLDRAAEPAAEVLLDGHAEVPEGFELAGAP